MAPILCENPSCITTQLERPGLCKLPRTNVGGRLLSSSATRLLTSRTSPSYLPFIPPASNDLWLSPRPYAFSRETHNVLWRGRKTYALSPMEFSTSTLMHCTKSLTLGTVNRPSVRNICQYPSAPKFHASLLELTHSRKPMASRSLLALHTSVSVRSKEYDLEQKLDVELRIREGTTRLLAACKHPSQNLEAAKTLRVSNARMAALRSELQLRGAGASSSNRDGNSAPCRGKVAVSELRLPLMWKETDHFKNRGDYRRFAVFCVASIDTEVQDTELVTPVDRSVTDITFTDTLYFSQIDPDFSMNVEVYACVLQDDLALASTPRKISRTLHSSITRTLGRKMAAKLKDGGAQEDPGPKFELVASCSLKLSDANDAIKSHDLSLENLENAHSQLPLFGQFCLRLAAQPDAFTDITEGPVQWQKRAGYAKLDGFVWQWWGKESAKDLGNEAEVTLQVNKFTALLLENKPSLKLVHGENVYQLDFTAKRDLDKWNQAFSQCFLDFRSWGKAAEQCMEIQSPVQVRREIIERQRHGSLYEQTPIHDNSLACIPERRQPRPALSDLFATPLPPSRSADLASTTPCQPTTRPRSLSNSTTSLKSWGSIKGIWPFNKGSD